MKAKKALSIVCLLFFSILLLLPCLTLLLMSFKSYHLAKGLFGSPYVGLANIQAFLDGTGLVRVLKNTLNINIFSIVIGALYLFVAILATNIFQNRIMKAIMALIFSLPAILPPNTYIMMLQTFLPTDFLVRSSTLLQIIAAAEGGLRFSAIFVIASLFTKGDSIPCAQKYVLLFVAMKLLNILATDVGFMNNFYNPLTYEHLDTYSTYQFRSGMMQSNFSGYAAGYVVQLLIQLLPALIGMYIIASPFRRSQRKTTIPSAAATAAGENKETTYQAYDSGNRVYLPCMLFAVLPIALLVLAWKASAEGSLELSNMLVQQAYANGFLSAAASAVVIVCFGLLLAAACVHLRSFGIGLTAFLYFLSDTLLGPYLIGRILGVHDTLFGIIIQNMYLILPIAIIAFRILKENRRKNLLPALTISSLGLAFAWFWGDHTAALVTVRSANKHTLSLMMHQLINRTGAIDYSAEATQLTAAPYILIPIVVTGLSFLIGSLVLRKYE